jgi:hypothetical protein
VGVSMGNNLTATGTKATGSAAGAIGCGTVIGGGALVFGGMWAYLSAENYGAPGWVGPAGLVAMIGTGIGGFIAYRVARNRAERRAAERAHQAWLESLQTIPVETHYAVWILSEPWQALMMWTNPQISVGRAPNQNFAGECPRLLPGQDPGYPPDPGYRESPNGTLLRLALPQGPSADTVRPRLANIASSLHVPQAQITSVHGEVFRLELKVRNSLAQSQRLPDPEDSHRDDKGVLVVGVPLKAARVGIREDGKWYRLQIWNTHLFLAGLTGSGKSGVLWSIIAALAPDILAGRVQLHMIDLKRGTEMAAGARLYTSWAYTVAAAIGVLEKMIRILDERATPRREHAERTGEPLRNHEPTPGDPHHVLMIDEIIALIKLVGDRKADFDVPQLDGTWKKENIRVDKYVGILLLELLSQARSFGITVIVATQNAAKEIFDLLRDMFPIVIGLRQASDQQVQMVYGTGARERGIEATAITVDQAGTAFIDSPEAGGSAMRVRFFKVEDEDIIYLVNMFGRPAGAIALPAAPTAAPVGGNVVELHPEDREDEDDDDQDEPLTEAERAGKVNRCRLCGKEIPPLPGGGRPAKFCRGTDHRQQYHRTMKRMAGGE